MSNGFSGQVIKRNSPDRVGVTAIQKRLVELGCGPLAQTGLFDSATEGAVRLFQTRFPDLAGFPMKVDGEVGQITWAALFGEAELPPITKAGSGLAKAALAKAASQIGVMEKPPGSNSGPEVDAYLTSVGVGSGNAWCAAFVWWCTNEAASELGTPNRLPKSAGVLDMWRKAHKAGLPCITKQEAIANTGLVTSGMLFIMNFGGGLGHVGFVEGFESGRLVTIEGNSNDGGSREGIGVFRLRRRTIGAVTEGFIGIP